MRRLRTRCGFASLAVGEMIDRRDLLTVAAACFVAAVITFLFAWGG